MSYQHRVRLVIVCSSRDDLRIVRDAMQGPRSMHLGISPGLLGKLHGADCVAVICGPAEAYAVAQQALHLFNPATIIEFSSAAGLAETLYPGDVVLASQVKRCYWRANVGPYTLPDPDMVYPDERTRLEVTTSSPLSFEAEDLLTSLSGCTRGLTCQQPEIRSMRVGSANALPVGTDEKLFAREMFDIDVVDVNGYAVASAAADAGVRALSIKLLTDAMRVDGSTEFSRWRRQYVAAAAEVLRTAAAILTASV